MNMSFQLSRDYERTAAPSSRKRRPPAEERRLGLLFRRSIVGAMLAGAAVYVLANASPIAVLCIAGAGLLLFAIATAVCIYAMDVTP